MYKYVFFRDLLKKLKLIRFTLRVNYEETFIADDGLGHFSGKIHLQENVTLNNRGKQAVF